MFEYTQSPIQSETIGKIASALAAAQASLPHAVKDKNNPFHKSKYADLAAVMNASASIHQFGLAITQQQLPHEKGVLLRTMLVHAESGEYISSIGYTPAKTLDPQGFGSALTYARRQGWATIIGIAQVDDDDDGELAHGRLNGQQIAHDSKPAVAYAKVTAKQIDHKPEPQRNAVLERQQAPPPKPSNGRPPAARPEGQTSPYQLKGTGDGGPLRENPNTQDEWQAYADAVVDEANEINAAAASGREVKGAIKTLAMGVAARNPEFSDIEYVDENAARLSWQHIFASIVQLGKAHGIDVSGVSESVGASRKQG